MTKKRKNTDTSSSDKGKGLSPKVRKAFENTATFGLLLVAVAIAVPFMNLDSGAWLSAFKWVYAAGALIFTIARIAGVNHPGDSFRLKRLRRLECWAGIAFVIGGFFWFYNESRFGGGTLGFSLAIMRETILFTLAGAMIQIIAVWLIYFREKKEASDNNGPSGNSQK